MALAYRCDKCGIFYDRPNSTDILSEAHKNNGRQIIKIEAFTAGMSREFDICKTCSDEFRNWMGVEKTKML